MSNLTEKQQKMKEKFIRERGYWADFWNDVLRLNEDYFEAYLKYSAVPWETGTLEPKVKELIYTAIDASTTHLYQPGLKAHIKNAKKYGATEKEIMEVLELTSILGIDTATSGIPILIEELEKNDIKFDNNLSKNQKKLKEKFKEFRGYWSNSLEQLLLVNEDFFEAFLELSSVPWKQGVLEPKVKELIYIAINAATTHLHETGIRIHIRNALNHGASKEEIIEVFQLVSVLGIHTFTEGVPTLVEVLNSN